MTLFIVAAHALIQKDGRFLATKRSAINDYKPGFWDIPGGTVHAGETVEETLAREVLEESGLTIVVKRPLCVYTNTVPLPEKQYFQAVYLCEHVAGDVRLNPEEHDEHAWVTLDELAKLESIAFVRDFIRRLQEGSVEV